MKAMLAGAAAIIIIGVGSNLVLGEMGFSAAETYAGDSVRLD
jgi:hypothetical protein